MSWFVIIALAGLAFGFAALVLRLPRSGYTLFGAALLFGLSGYALQGSPDRPGLPTQSRADSSRMLAMLVETRRDFHDPATLPSRFLLTSDAFARRGDTVNAAGFARSAVLENPADAEAWTALGNALVEHAGGRMTPAARHAFDRARAAAPDAPAPAFFLGLALLRDGKPEEAREVWAELVTRAPADAPWLPGMVARMMRLDALIAATRR